VTFRDKVLKVIFRLPRPSEQADAIVALHGAEVKRWREATVEFFAAIDEEHPRYGGHRENPTPYHSHEVRGIWDWDNGPKANKPCRECAAWDGLRALLSADKPGKE
jgi:hypothetical protein